VIQFFSSDFVVKSTLSHLVKYAYILYSAHLAYQNYPSALYMRIMDNFEHFAGNVEECMQQVIDLRSFKDPAIPAHKDPLGNQVIASLAGVFFEYVTPDVQCISFGVILVFFKVFDPL
jgi:hypothetical protein